ncbi:MAG TPA: hypothetical protein DEO84_07675 [candidate division Zixibacteria bacterium]|nr:hypothetical protein [candidate division Zixibacteria bacterium]
MKKLLLLALAACIPFGIAMAQDPANFHAVYGNTDGSPISVGLDRDVDIPIWMSTDPTPGNPDTVSSMHMALMSDDLIITGRLGGAFVPAIAGHWDDISFLAVDDHTTDPAVPVGFHSQSIFGVAYLTDPPDAAYWIYTLGAWYQLGTYKVHTANDPALIGTTPCPFSQGHNTANGSPWWGMADGVRSVAPTTSYGCLYFSPNAAPTWVTLDHTVDVYGGVPFSFTVAGADADLANTLTITGPGGIVAIGTGGTVTGTYTGTVAASTDLVFTLFDGTDYAATSLTIHVNVLAVGGLIIGNPDGSCIYGYPGGDVWVRIFYNTDIYCGGFDLITGTDPTALTLTDFYYTGRVNDGDEFNQHIVAPYGVPGTDKWVWIANMNDGVYTPPAPPTLEPILWLKYHISPSIGIGALVNLFFVTTGPDSYTYNTTSDSTGYDFIHPPLAFGGVGCVNVISPNYFKGDPNMNGIYYEIADDVLVARRLIHGVSDTWIWTINLPVQEAAADLNNNGFADIADLVRFINITVGAVPMPPHPKTDANAVDAYVSFKDGNVAINSAVEVGGALVRIAHTGEIGVPVVANGMDMLYEDANGVLSVVVFSKTAQRIPAGTQTLFTVEGNGTVSEASAADANGELLISRVGAPVPTDFVVSNNYPNPFNAQTRINFALPTASDVTINIYSITGQVVETLKGSYEAGNQSVIWDASNVASGVYFAKVSTGSNSQTLKMTLLK